MKIALSIWKDCISTVFDTADQLLIFEIDGKDGPKRSMVKLNAADVVGRANQIKEKQIEVLVCGAISKPLEAYLVLLGIQVYPFVRGSVTEVLAAYQNGRLDHAIFALPGCRGRGCPGNRQQIRRMRSNWK